MLLHGEQILLPSTLLVIRLLLAFLIVFVLDLVRVQLVRVRVHHARDLLGELKQVYAVFWVACNDLVSFYVFQVVHQNVLAQHVDKGLDVGSHFIVVLCLDQLTEVAVREGRHKKLHVELVSSNTNRLSEQIAGYVKDDRVAKLLTERKLRRPGWVLRSPCCPKFGFPSPKSWR